jgi:DNA replication protein DnaC
VQITTRETFEGTLVINKVQSWAVWREWFRGKNLPTKATYGHDGICIRCEDDGWFNSVEFGPVMCICSILKLEANYKRISYEYRTRFETKSLDDIEPWGDIQSQDEIITAVDYFKEWIKWPDKWVHIQGKVGCGKSHILAALACELGPWALYITAADLESKIFQALNDHSLEQLVEDIESIPILLLDDIGLDYGSEFPKSQMRKIIDFRYLQPQEFVTVTTTNLLRPELRQYDLRISDRILDDKVGHIIRMPNVGSWRTQHNANSK